MTYYQELQPTIIEGIVDSFGVEAGDVAVCVEQILAAQVPVETDYAAATAKLVEQGPSDLSDENVAHNVVDAALGIGDTDECPNGCDPGCQCHD